jgi:hypothetical protein
MTNLEPMTLGLKGFLTVTKVFPDDSKEILFKEENLIVNGGRLIAIRQLQYSSGSGDPLSYAKIGTGGATDGAGLYLKTPVATMTDLYTPVALQIPIVKTGHDDSIPTITLLANVDNAVANGIYINEAGFFSASGTMFNIKTFPRVLKTSAFSLTLTWVLQVF